MKRGSSHPYLLFMSGVMLTLIGIVLIAVCVSYSTPFDYHINAFDAIFVIPAIIKVLYYETLKELSKAGIPCGIMFTACGVFCIIFGIRGIRRDDYISYFKKGDVPDEEEMRSLLETGELTQEEYLEIQKYIGQKK